MKKIFTLITITIFLFAFSLLSFANEETYTIIEGKGIESIALLGETIQQVEKRLGKPNRSVRDDWPYSPYYFHEYHEKGILFTTYENGIIINITVYCNTGDNKKFHETGLKWINPSTIYRTFQGITKKGLKLRDRLMPKDIYDIYGKPTTIIKLNREAGEKIKAQKEPFIYDMGTAGYSIHYPNLEISFTTFNEMVESFTVANTEKKK